MEGQRQYTFQCIFDYTTHAMIAAEFQDSDSSQFTAWARDSWFVPSLKLALQATVCCAFISKILRNHMIKSLLGSAS
jgi:hypothetical protein